MADKKKNGKKKSDSQPGKGIAGVFDTTVDTVKDVGSDAKYGISSVVESTAETAQAVLDKANLGQKSDKNGKK